MTNDSTAGIPRTVSGATGYIARTFEGHARAAAPTPAKAREIARAIGLLHVVYLDPATAAELDALDLPPAALGIAPGGAPWWRKPAPKAPIGPVHHPVTTPAGLDAIGTVVHVWGPVTGHDPELGMPVREDLGTGRLLGWLRRDRTYLASGTAGEARAAHDVNIPIVEALDGNGYVPSYPRCPDCGGAVVIAWAQLPDHIATARVPGLRRCVGGETVGDVCRDCDGEGVMPCPDCNPEGDAESGTACETCNTFTFVGCSGCDGSGEWHGCGSTFVDTRFGVAMAVPAAEDSP